MITSTTERRGALPEVFLDHGHYADVSLTLMREEVSDAIENIQDETA